MPAARKALSSTDSHQDAIDQIQFYRVREIKVPHTIPPDDRITAPYGAVERGAGSTPAPYRSALLGKQRCEIAGIDHDLAAHIFASDDRVTDYSDPWGQQWMVRGQGLHAPSDQVYKSVVVPRPPVPIATELVGDVRRYAKLPPAICGERRQTNGPDARIVSLDWSHVVHSAFLSLDYRGRDVRLRGPRSCMCRPFSLPLPLPWLALAACQYESCIECYRIHCCLL